MSGISKKRLFIGTIYIFPIQFLFNKYFICNIVYHRVMVCQMYYLIMKGWRKGEEGEEEKCLMEKGGGGGGRLVIRHE